MSKQMKISEFIENLVASDLKAGATTSTFQEVISWLKDCLYGIDSTGSALEAYIQNDENHIARMGFLGDLAPDQSPNVRIKVEYSLANKALAVQVSSAGIADEGACAPVDAKITAAPGLVFAALLLADTGLINSSANASSVKLLRTIGTSTDLSKLARDLILSVKKGFPSEATVSFQAIREEVPADASPSQISGLKKLLPDSGNIAAGLEPFSKFVRKASNPWSPWHESLIPKGIYYESNGQDLEIVELAISKGMAVLLEGEAGAGKTTLVQSIAETHKMPLIVLTGHGQISVEDLLGGMVLKKGSTEVEPAGLARACEDGCWVVINEPNAMPLKVQQCLYGLLDETRMVTLGNRVIKVHEDTRFFFTTNPVGYLGVRPMTEAFMSRIGIKLAFPQPTKKVFMSVISKKVPGVKTHVVDLAWKICETIRRAVKDEIAATNPDSFYLRDAIAFSAIAQHLKPKVAFEVTALAAWQNAEERRQIQKLTANILK